MHLTATAWALLGAIAFLSMLFMRLSVRVVAKEADNAWDNAVGYVVASAFMGWAAWKVCAGGPLMGWALAPVLLWSGQTIALAVIYEIRATRAISLGMLHTAIMSVVVSSLGLGTAALAAYLLFGKIVSDPTVLIRLLLWLVGLRHSAT